MLYSTPQISESIPFLFKIPFVSFREYKNKFGHPFDFRHYQCESMNIFCLTRCGEVFQTRKSTAARTAEYLVYPLGGQVPPSALEAGKKHLGADTVAGCRFSKIFL